MTDNTDPEVKAVEASLFHTEQLILASACDLLGTNVAYSAGHATEQDVTEANDALRSALQLWAMDYREYLQHTDCDCTPCTALR